MRPGARGLDLAWRACVGASRQCATAARDLSRSSLHGERLWPERSQLELHRFKRFGPHLLGASEVACEHPAALVSAEYLEGSVGGIDQPDMSHTLAKVDGHFLHPV